MSVLNVVREIVLFGLFVLDVIYIECGSFMFKVGCVN